MQNVIKERSYHTEFCLWSFSQQQQQKSRRNVEQVNEFENERSTTRMGWGGSILKYLKSYASFQTFGEMVEKASYFTTFRKICEQNVK